MIVKFFYIFALIITALIGWSCYINYTAMTCPKKGSFIGWKCAYYKPNPAFEGGAEFVLVKLEIPEDAKRSSAPHRRKCRCSKAKVLEIVTLDEEKPIDMAHSLHDPSFVYRVGEEVFVDNFCEDRMMECAAGIHFFMEKEEAMRYIQ